MRDNTVIQLVLKLRGGPLSTVYDDDDDGYPVDYYDDRFVIMYQTTLSTPVPPNGVLLELPNIFILSSAEIDLSFVSTLYFVVILAIRSSNLYYPAGLPRMMTARKAGAGTSRLLSWGLSGDTILRLLELKLYQRRRFVPYRRRGARGCLLYTSPSPRDGLLSRMPSSA